MKPILFNTEMVQAILAGRKSVTRRIVKPQPKMQLAYICMGCNHGKWAYPSPGCVEQSGWDVKYRRPEGLTAEDCSRCWTPPYHTGNILYVRETWARPSESEISAGADPNMYLYKADRIQPVAWGVWHPSIHMPKEAARIFLRVTDVRVERLQDITMDGMQREGVVPANVAGRQWPQWQRDYMRLAWDATIDKANLPRYGWNANPWVWVIEFEQISKAEAQKGGGGNG